MQVTVKQIEIPKDTRVICISDIHGSLTLFKRLLEKVSFCDNDTLVILGDIYLKGGEESQALLKYVVELSKNSNVHILRGNCDVVEDEYLKALNNPPFILTDYEKEWVEALPTIIESEDYMFVHGGLTAGTIDKEANAYSFMKNDNFMEQGIVCKKWCLTGHWPVDNYAYNIPKHTPIINEDLKIIAIDGGNMIRPSGGQLNAFIIEGDKFLHDFVDNYSTIVVEKSQLESGGNLNITWLDRFIEIVEKGEEFSLCKHIKTGQIIEIPNFSIWEDDGKNLCASSLATDYYLEVSKGETVSLIEKFSDRIYAKKGGISGWIKL